MVFHDTYFVRTRDNLTSIGRQFLFDNPGPIFAYPPNADRFHNKSPHLIYPNEKLLIPWHPSLLQKYIATCNYLAQQVTDNATKFIHEQIHNKDEIDDFLHKIDALNFLASLHVGIGSLAVQGMKGVEMNSKQALIWLVESRATVFANVTTLAVPNPTAPKKDYKFYIRHALGPWNPSYWASVVAAIKEKDVDIYLYGSDAVNYKACQKIKQQAEADISELKKRLKTAETQLLASFYKYRL
ncbi:MAG TPA: hypothetical protein PKN24_15805 [bacterium]|nr:hypothetical protein [bacterium]